MDDGVLPRPGAAEAMDAVLQLWALRLVDDEGWAAYVAGKPSEGWHLLRLPADVYRRLRRGEVYGWCLGVADGYGWGHLIDELAARPMPQLLTVLEASERLAGLRPSLHTRLQQGDFYVVYARSAEQSPANVRRRWLRCLFAEQVQLEAATAQVSAVQRHGRRFPEQGEPADMAQLQAAAEAARLAWSQVVEHLPPQPLVDDPGPLPEELPSPDPLPVADRRSGRADWDRALQAIMIGDQQGWYGYAHPADEQAGFVVDLHGNDRRKTPARRRIVPAEYALPWVLGVADRHGAGPLVAYRDGLG